MHDAHAIAKYPNGAICRCEIEMKLHQCGVFHGPVDTDKHTTAPKAGSGDKNRVATCNQVATKLQRYMLVATCNTQTATYGNCKLQHTATANCSRCPIKPQGRSLFTNGPQTDFGEQRTRVSSLNHQGLRGARFSTRARHVKRAGRALARAIAASVSG